MTTPTRLYRITALCRDKDGLEHAVMHSHHDLGQARGHFGALLRKLSESDRLIFVELSEQDVFPNQEGALIPRPAEWKLVEDRIIERPFTRPKDRYEVGRVCERHERWVGRNQITDACWGHVWNEKAKVPA